MYLLSIILIFIATTASGQILLVRKGNDDFVKFSELVKRDIGKNYKVDDYVISQTTEYKEFYEKVKGESPKLLILLDNMSVNFAKRMYVENPTMRNIKSIASMGLNLQHELQGSKWIAGVGYETSGYSIVTEFRKAIKEPIKKILVFYRKSVFSSFVLDAAKQLEREQLELFAVDLEVYDVDARDKVIIKKLERYKDKVDAVWVISDNILMNKDNFGPVWIYQARTTDLPFLCGLEKFSQVRFDFCAFSAFPSLEGLASHLVELGYSILEDGVEPEEIGVEYIVSISKQINKRRLEKLNLHLSKGADELELNIVE